MLFGYYSDSWIILAMLVVMVIGLAAQAGVKNAFNKYSKVKSLRAQSASEVARELLYRGGSTAELRRVGGELTDHFNPKTNEVGLSEAVYDDSSIAALAVAAHEIGHVMQYQEGYAPIKIRNAIVPVARIGSTAAPWLVLLGLIMGSANLAMFGAVLFGAILLFQLVTLPVEFNASHRAIEMLASGGYISSADEEAGAKKVLRAAALTYVVAALSAFVSFLRLFLLASRTRRR